MTASSTQIRGRDARTTGRDTVSDTHHRGRDSIFEDVTASSIQVTEDVIIVIDPDCALISPITSPVVEGKPQVTSP